MKIVSEPWNQQWAVKRALVVCMYVCEPEHDKKQILKLWAVAVEERKDNLLSMLDNWVYKIIWQ